MTVMAAGLAAVVRRLHGEGKLDGILGMGGSGGTSIATTAMRVLPIGVPKVMVSTVGGGDVSAYTGSKDIVFIPSIVDVAGINRISQAIYGNAAGAISGMVTIKAPAAKQEKPLITASMFGNTTKCVDHAREVMEKAGYEVLVFHTTGSGRPHHGEPPCRWIHHGLAGSDDHGARRRGVRRRAERGAGSHEGGGGEGGSHRRGAGMR